MRIVAFIFLFLLLNGCSMERLYQMRQRQRVFALEQFHFNDLLNTYMTKEQSSVGSIEGIYSVSSVVTRKGRSLLSANEKEKVTDRKDNYSKVAIVRYPYGGQREFIELSMDKEYVPSLPIVGEFSNAADGNLLVYRHFESRGRESSYTFAYDAEQDLLEGIRTENNGTTVITYKLTYLKLAPKKQR